MFVGSNIRPIVLCRVSISASKLSILLAYTVYCTNVYYIIRFYCFYLYYAICIHKQFYSVSYINTLRYKSPESNYCISVSVRAGITERLQRPLWANSDTVAITSLARALCRWRLSLGVWPRLLHGAVQRYGSQRPTCSHFFGFFARDWPFCWSFPHEIGTSDAVT